MCTTIGHTIPIAGSAKGPGGWLAVDRAVVGYDHPTHARVEHALTLDFVDEATATRVAAELTRASGRELVAALIRALDEADAYEGKPTDADATP